MTPSVLLSIDYFIYNKIENIYSWSFEAFVKHYQLIRNNGLEEKLLDDLAWKIENLLENYEIVGLKNSEFYKQFGDHTIIEDALMRRQI